MPPPCRVVTSLPTFRWAGCRAVRAQACEGGIEAEVKKGVVRVGILRVRVCVCVAW